MRSFPGRECVGAESGVHQRQVRVKVGVKQVHKVVPQLVGREQTFVHDRLDRQRTNVEATARLGQRVCGPFAQNEDLAYELRFGQVGRDERLSAERFRLFGHLTDGIAVGRHRAPTENGHAEARRQFAELAFAVAVRNLVQEEDAGGVGTERRQLDASLGPEIYVYISKAWFIYVKYHKHINKQPKMFMYIILFCCIP